METPLPTAIEIAEDLAVAAVAVNAAVDTRRRLRRRTHIRDPERRAKIETRVSDLEGHGSVLRSHLKRSDHHSPPFTPYSAVVRRRIKRLLREMRYERRQLKKMLPADNDS